MMERKGGADMDKLLLVEDDTTLIRMVRDYLTGEGFAVTAVMGQSAAQSLTG